MKTQRFLKFFCAITLSLSVPLLSAGTADIMSQEELKALYDFAQINSSDINEHVPVLEKLAEECSSVAEIGVRSMVSSWGLLYGLAKNPSLNCSYLGIDLNLPPEGTYLAAKRLAESHGISFDFWQVNDMTIELREVELLFIDSLHTYCHLTYELEKFSPKVSKYIAMHDTSAPWGNQDDTEYRGDYSEYPRTINRIKRGLWPAVSDFLSRHPEWKLMERRYNNHGFTILKRVEPQQ